MVGAIASKTVQVHLNRRCNLACAHCYSASGPRETEELAAPTLIRFLGEAADEGYGVVAFSGGEPFLYPDFVPVLEAAKSLGLRRLAVTNGTVLTERRAAALALLDLVAVSVDGREAVHNRIRRSPTAFARMLKGLDAVRAAGLPFGIAHTVTRDSLPDLPWMAEFAVAQGASILQLHPLGMVGAATGMAGGPAGAALDGEILARSWLTARALQADYGERLVIHVDLFNRATLAARPELVVPGEAGDRALLSDILNPLVLMSNGDLSPICHAMGPALRLGRMDSAPLPEIARRFRRTGLADLRALCRGLWEEVVADEGGWPYLNWYELLETRAQSAHPAPPGRGVGRVRARRDRPRPAPQPAA